VSPTRITVPEFDWRADRARFHVLENGSVCKHCSGEFPSPAGAVEMVIAADAAMHPEYAAARAAAMLIIHRDGCPASAATELRILRDYERAWRDGDQMSVSALKHRARFGQLWQAAFAAYEGAR
jgi:hypothetical protein